MPPGVPAVPGGRRARYLAQYRPRCLRCPAPLRAQGGSHSWMWLLCLRERLFLAFQFGKELFAINAFPAAQRIPAFINLLTNGLFTQLCQLVTFFKEPEGFTDYFAGRVIPATPDLGLDQLFELGCQMDIHRMLLWKHTVYI